MGVVSFIWARPSGRQINLSLLSSFWCGLGAVGFIQMRSLVSFGFVGFIWSQPRCCSVLSGAHLWSPGSFGFVMFIRAWPAGGRVHFGLLRSSKGVVWLNPAYHGRHWVSYCPP